MNAFVIIYLVGFVGYFISCWSSTLYSPTSSRLLVTQNPLWFRVILAATASLLWPLYTLKRVFDTLVRGSL